VNEALKIYGRIVIDMTKST